MARQARLALKAATTSRMIPPARQPRCRRPWLAPAAGLALLLAGALPLGALELGGATYFARAPWKADLVSYDTTVGSAPVWYYLTLRLDPEAGASLGRLSFQQTRGSDWDFPFSAELTRAFLGRPRREGRAVPVRASFDQKLRRITVDFPEPIPPGETVTVVLRPWTNPMQSDTYMFDVVVWPAGPNPMASPVGLTTLRIYDRMPL